MMTRLRCCLEGGEDLAQLFGWPTATFATMAGVHGCPCNSASKGVESAGRAFHKQRLKYLAHCFEYLLDEEPWLTFFTVSSLMLNFVNMRPVFSRMEKNQTFQPRPLLELSRCVMLLTTISSNVYAWNSRYWRQVFYLAQVKFVT